MCRRVADPWRPPGEQEGSPSHPYRAPTDMLPQRDLIAFRGLWGGGLGSEGAKGSLGTCRKEGRACWGPSLPAPRSQLPRPLAPAEGPLEPPTPGPGVPQAPHLLALGPGRPRLLIPRSCNGTSPPLPEGRSLGPGARGWGRAPGWGSPLPRLRCLGWLGWARAPAPTRAVAGRGLRGAVRRGERGRRGRGRAGRGGPSLSRLQVSQPPSLGGRRERLVPPSSRLHASIPPSFMCPSVHSLRSFAFNIPASAYAAFRAHLLCAGGPPGSFGEPQCWRWVPAPPLPAALPS